MKWWYGPIHACIVLIILCWICCYSHAISFDLHNGDEQCFYENLKRGDLCTGEFSIKNNDNKKKRVTITALGTDGDIEFMQEMSIAYRFGFVAKSDGRGTLCFRNNENTTQRITFALRYGAEAQDLKDIIKQYHLTPPDAQVLRIAETMKTIIVKLVHVRDIENMIRDMNEKLSTRISMSALLSMSIACSLGVWQVFRLRNYLIVKKII